MAVTDTSSFNGRHYSKIMIIFCQITFPNNTETYYTHTMMFREIPKYSLQVKHSCIHSVQAIQSIEINQCRRFAGKPEHNCWIVWMFNFVTFLTRKVQKGPWKCDCCLIKWRVSPESCWWCRCANALGGPPLTHR